MAPRAPTLETLIEFFHRLSSGVALLMVLRLLVWAFRTYPMGRLLRKAAVGCSVFILLEAAVGAGLVLLIATTLAHSAPPSHPLP